MDDPWMVGRFVAHRSGESDSDWQTAQPSPSPPAGDGLNASNCAAWLFL